MKSLRYTILFLLFFTCNSSEEKKVAEIRTFPKIEQAETPILHLEEANRLAELPMHCIQTEYPNKLGQTIGGPEDLKEPKALHPAFYGCFDWHSAVHGHWSLMSLLKQFPELDKKETIEQMLLQNISKENILDEVSLFLW